MIIFLIIAFLACVWGIITNNRTFKVRQKWIEEIALIGYESIEDGSKHVSFFKSLDMIPYGKTFWEIYTFRSVTKPYILK